MENPLIMGIVNATPNSFSDGGRYLEPNKAYELAQELISQGADMLDIGGESSRPGASSISSDEEISRVIPVIERVRATSDICISIDTCKPAVMQAAVAAGASVINDITALGGEGAISMALKLNVPICLMHMLGIPADMQDNPQYAHDIVDEINHFFRQRIKACLEAGIPRELLILDPGFGFGKTIKHNLLIVKHLSEFKQHNLPLLIGASRKNTIGVILNKPVLERLSGGLAIAVFAILNGVMIIRTHDVDETNQAIKMVNAIIMQTK